MSRPGFLQGTGLISTMLIVCTGLSQFHRAALGVVAPDLARDLSASPEMLGAANFWFFLAFVVAQIPIGVALDRIGPRRVVGWLTLLAVLGAGGQALARDGTEFAVARFLLGLGCSASFMSMVVLCARWYRGDRLTAALSLVIGFSQVGILFAAAPMAWASSLVGWRGAMVVSAVATAVMGVAWAVWVRDAPPDRPPPQPQSEGLRQLLVGQFRVWKTPGLAPVLSMHVFAYAAAATVLGLWAGPYLADVHHLEARERGWVLLAMGLALPISLLAVAPLERRFNTRKWLVVAGAALSAATLVGLAVIPNLALWPAIVLLVGLCLFTCYPVLVVAHGRALFSDGMVGRGATTVNLAQVIGSAALPALAGWVIGGFAELPGGGRPEIAYRLAFGALGFCLVLGLVGYLFSKDAPPRPIGKPGPVGKSADMPLSS